MRYLDALTPAPGKPIKPGLRSSSEPHDLDRSLDIVGQDGQDHLGPVIGRLAGQEMPLIPMVLECSERILG